jgi:hypothetical protein
MLNAAIPFIVGVGPAVVLVAMFVLLDYRRSRRS